VESFIAPVDMTINGEFVKKGSWLLGVKIFDKDAWEAVKSGELFSGFSFRGGAKIDPNKTL
jgi:hypothetical protein